MIGMVLTLAGLYALTLAVIAVVVGLVGMILWLIVEGNWKARVLAGVMVASLAGPVLWAIAR